MLLLIVYDLDFSVWVKNVVLIIIVPKDSVDNLITKCHAICKQKHTVLFLQPSLSISSIWRHDYVKYILFLINKSINITILMKIIVVYCCTVTPITMYISQNNNFVPFNNTNCSRHI